MRPILPLHLATLGALTLSPSLAMHSRASAAPEPEPVALPVPDILHAKADDAERLTVPVHVGAHGPYRFLVDTGAERTVFTDSLAATLALALGAHRLVAGVTGSVNVPTVAAEDIRFDHRAFASHLVPLLPAQDVSADGIVGLDGLQGLRVLFDFRRNTLALTDAHPRGWEDGYEIVVRATRRGGQLIMTHAEVDGVDTDVVIDTGAETSIGNMALAHALRRRLAREATRLQGVTGQTIDADLAFGATMKLDRLEMTDMTIAFADSRVFTILRLDKRPALLLGMHELRSTNRLAIDFDKRRVLFDVGA